MKDIREILDSEGDFTVAKSIVQSGQMDEEWDFLRQGKGIWPVEKETWKQFRAYSLQELKDEMKVHKQSKGNKYFLCIFLNFLTVFCCDFFWWDFHLVFQIFWFIHFWFDADDSNFPLFPLSILLTATVSTAVAVVTYSVPAFGVDFELNGDFLLSSACTSTSPSAVTSTKTALLLPWPDPTARTSMREYLPSRLKKKITVCRKPLMTLRASLAGCLIMCGCPLSLALLWRQISSRSTHSTRTTPWSELFQRTWMTWWTDGCAWLQLLTSPERWRCSWNRNGW